MSTPRLPTPADRYSAEDQRRSNSVIESELGRRWERFEDIEASVSRIILTSPNGTRYELTVDDAGAIGTTPVAV